MTTELHEILELYCELLLARIGLLDASPTCDAGLEEAVKSLIYAAPRTDIKELHQTRQLLVEKFGREFAALAMAEGEKPTGQESVVPDRVRRKLRVEPPGSELVESYLKAIASAYDVRYGEDGDENEDGQVEGQDGSDGNGAENNDNDNNDDDHPSSGGRALAEPPLPAQALKSVHMTPPRDLGPRSPVSVAPPSPSTLNPNPRVRLPDGGPRPPVLKPNARMKGIAALNNGAAGMKKPEGEIPDVDDLEKRFALLKK